MSEHKSISGIPEAAIRAIRNSQRGGTIKEQVEADLAEERKRRKLPGASKNKKDHE